MNLLNINVSAVIVFFKSLYHIQWLLLARVTTSSTNRLQHYETQHGGSGHAQSRLPPQLGILRHQAELP